MANLAPGQEAPDRGCEVAADDCRRDVVVDMMADYGSGEVGLRRA
jgi:hypothetical protein